MKLLSGRMVSVSRPENWVNRSDSSDAARARRQRCPDRGPDRPNVIGRRAATAAEDVDESRLRKVAQQPRGVGRQLVVLAEGVRQPGVRIAGDVTFGDPCELGEERAHLFGAQRAVQADAERLRMPDGHVEGVERLT